MPAFKDLPELRRMAQRNIRTLSKINSDTDYYQIKLRFHYPFEKEFYEKRFNEEYEEDDSVPAYVYADLYDLENSQPLEPEIIDRNAWSRQLLDLNEIIIKDEEITILFGVPFPTVYKYKYNSKNGFTRLDLLRCIYEGFADIFKAYEANDIHIGHEFGDLIIEGIWYNTKTKTVDMIIGS